jgi:hypothetical protein
MPSGRVRGTPPGYIFFMPRGGDPTPSEDRDAYIAQLADTPRTIQAGDVIVAQ